MLQIKIIPDSYSVVRLDPKAKIPSRAMEGEGNFFSITRTHDELSVVCKSSLVPSDEDLRLEEGWGCLKVVGPLDFGLTGILSQIAAPLALAKISIFAISTFDTDYILVKLQKLQHAKQVLFESGIEFI